ncbi:hypothetical protein ACIP88_36750 [Streptomyces uncialis]|uniref:hypothetical protein n=1 Tax=Streptomyces uncialis TaxID=1048205 RepID=UPI0037F2E7F8
MSGDEVEAVVSNLLYSDLPRAHRIRPSQGDYGIDILAPSTTKEGAFDVYQIKKFAANLTDSQKGQIKKSFRALLLGAARRNIPVADWYLVMPLDPTLENLEWFNAMPDEVISETLSNAKLSLTEIEKEKIAAWKGSEGRTFAWKGHRFCEALASKFWYVPDYYLHGGRERIRSAVSEMTKILQRDLTHRIPEASDATSILQPAEIIDHLRRLQSCLDGDPHFRYGISMDPTPPDLTQENDLIAAAQEVSADGTCTTIRIYSRFAEALNERPIPIEVNFRFTESVPESFNQWVKYGKPLSSPAGFKVDLPGGLKADQKRGTVHIGPAVENSSVHRYRIVTPEGGLVSEMRFTTSYSEGLNGDGRWASGKDSSGLLQFESLIDTRDPSLELNFSLEEITGQSVTRILEAVRFASGLAHPNLLQTAEEYGPFSQLGVIKGDPLAPTALLNYIDSLVTLQGFTKEPICVPDFTQMTAEDVRGAFTAASLLKGNTVVRNWVSLDVSHLNPGVEPPLEGEYQVMIIKPLKVRVGEREYSFGATSWVMLSAGFSLDNGRLRAIPRAHSSAHQNFLPNHPAPQGEVHPVSVKPCRPSTRGEHSNGEQD